MYDVIVIGSGIGGLSCAAALSKSGWRALVLEQHYVAGGCTHMFTRKGYSWDVGIHCVGQMSEREVPGRLLRWLSDGEIQMNSLGNPYDRIYLPGQPELKIANSQAELAQTLKARYPGEDATIDRYFALVHQAADSMSLYFLSRALPRWPAAGVQKAAHLLGKDWWLRTTREVLDSITPHPALKSALASQWGYYGATPSRSSFGVHAVTVRHFLDGGYYPVGGSKTIAEALAKTIRAAGGEIRTRAGVSQVMIENGRAVGVRLENGEEIRATRVVSSIGAVATGQRLLPESAPEPAKQWARELGALEQSPAYLTLYLGFEGDLTETEATISNQWHYEDADMERSLWHIEEEGVVPPFIFVSFPSLKDPHHDPGPTVKHTGELIVFVDWKHFAPWKHTRRGKREPDYHAFKRVLEERLLSVFRAKFPRLAQKLKFVELSTPLSTSFFIRAPQGAIYGLAPTPERHASPVLRTRTPVPGLYLSGCDVAALGVAGALTGGILTAGTLDPRILRRLV